MHTIGSDLLAFGELLKGFRIRKYLTQQQLAEAVGVHRNAVGRWERGDFLPASRGMILELARKLYLDDHETRQLLETSLTALSPGFHVPFHRNTFFTGRERFLTVLHERLVNEHGEVPLSCYALYGLGGIGKTQIALEYAYRHVLEYSAVFWIASETDESILASMVCIAEVLQLPERAESDQQQIIAAVQHWLATHRMWLLVWDNLEDLTLLQRFLPPVRQGTVLITTQNSVMGTVAQGLEVLPMEKEEGITLLLRRAKVVEAERSGEQIHQFKQCCPEEYTAAEELVYQLGGLPLALDQAGAYIDENACRFAGYLQRYKQQRIPLLDRRGAFAGDHVSSALTTLERAFQRVEQRSPVALELLRCSAFLSADTLPEAFFHQGASCLGPLLGPIAADPLQLDQALAVLRSVSLVQRDHETQTFSLYRFVQIILREKMTGAQRLLWLKRVADGLNTIFPEVTHSAWQQCEQLLPHVLMCNTLWLDDQGDLKLAMVVRKAADYVYERGSCQQAEALYRRALSLWDQVPTAEHPEEAFLLYHLALLLVRQEKYEQAGAFFPRACALLEKCLGQVHPKTVQAHHDYQCFQQHLLALPHRSVARSMHIAVRGKSEQVAYTRQIKMREVTITCQVCGQTVTQLRYPGGRISYCSDACKAVRMTQINVERVRKQREKRRTRRESGS